MMENKSPIPPGNKLPGYLGVFFIVLSKMESTLPSFVL